MYSLISPEANPLDSPTFVAKVGEAVARLSEAKTTLDSREEAAAAAESVLRSVWAECDPRFVKEALRSRCGTDSSPLPKSFSLHITSRPERGYVYALGHSGGAEPEAWIYLGRVLIDDDYQAT